MLSKQLAVALKAADKARDAILEVYNSNNIGLEIKSDDSPVTDADKKADKIIKDILMSEFPEYGLLTEESYDDMTRLNKDYVWIVDPLDGTKEFVNHDSEFTICIGLSYKHKAILGVILIPCTGEIYYAEEGLGSFYLKNNQSQPVKIRVSDKVKDITVLISRYHAIIEEENLINEHKDLIKKIEAVGSSIKGCYIAHGKAEATYRFTKSTKEWDTCAMQAIVEQAGGHLLKMDGTPIKYNREDVYNRDGYVIVNNKQNFIL